MSADAQLLEREEALDLLRTVFERGRERGAAVIVDGPAGSGKSSLLAAGCELALAGVDLLSSQRSPTPT